MMVPQPAGPATRRQNLPRQLTPFVGREEDLAEIGRLLADPTCWLLTLVGPGTVMRADTLRRYALDAGFREVEVLPIENFFFRFYRLYA